MHPPPYYENKKILKTHRGFTNLREIGPTQIRPYPVQPPTTNKKQQLGSYVLAYCVMFLEALSYDSYCK